MKFIQELPVLIIVIPLIFALIIPLVGRLNRLLPWVIASTITFFCFLTSISLLITVLDTGKISYWLGGWEPPWGIEYAIDYLNAFVLAVVSFIAFIVSLYSRRSVELEINEDKQSAFYCIYMLFITGLMGIVITGDIFNIYVFLEISSLAGYALIAIGKKREALVASYNYLILGTIAATFILIGIGYIYMATGTLNIGDLQERLPALFHSKMVLVALAFFTVGLSLKLALFPLHTWLPGAYTHAPSVVSCIMAATATKVGVYAMLRIIFGVFKIEFDIHFIPIANILIVISSMAIIAGSALAIAQTNLKRMLAYSSVGQIGYIVLGAVLANQLAMTGSIIHILNHALMKGALFMVVGCIVYKTGIEDISGLNGMGKKMPFTMAVFTIAGLSMMGVPLTVGFVSKWYIAIGALNAGMWYLIPVIITGSLLSAVYVWRIIVNIYFPEELPEHELQYTDGGAEIDYKSQYSEAPWSMLAPTIALAVLCIYFGITATTPLSIAEKAAVMLLQ